MQADDVYKASNVPTISIEGKESPFRTVVALLEYLRNGICMIGVPSVENLYSFLYGYAYAKANSGDSDGLHYLSKFNSWVRERYGTASSQGWGKIIAFYSTSESEGLALFWKLYDDFLAHSKPVH